MPSEVAAGRKKVKAGRFTPIEERGGSRPAFLEGIGRSRLWTCPWGERMGFSEGKKGQESGYGPREKGWASVEEGKGRSPDTPLGRERMGWLQWRKERSGVRILPWGERMGWLQWRKERSGVRILPWGERMGCLKLRNERSGVRIWPLGERMGFSGGKKGHEIGYAPGENDEIGSDPGENGWASEKERKVRSQDTSPGRKNGLQWKKDR
jgi:hypothetical protein